MVKRRKKAHKAHKKTTHKRKAKKTTHKRKAKKATHHKNARRTVRRRKTASGSSSMSVEQ